MDVAIDCRDPSNGEIYNSGAASLAGGESSSSSSDTEVVLKAYARWGLDAIPRLCGIFATAIWDLRSRCAHLARPGARQMNPFRSSTPVMDSELTFQGCFKGVPAS